VAVVAIKITCIYCLYDPRDPQQIPMYVGKGNKIGLKAIGLNFYEEKLLLMGYLGDGLKNLS
jgi:hypothetical protein